MEILIKVLQLITSLSILVILHEGGHFLPAKWFKTRVEKFYLFFDAKFALFKKKIGETEYGIGWIPLGGYVKIAGMIDESFDKEQMKGEPQPWEFRSKPAWQRFIIMIGGVTVNILLGIFLFIMMFAVYGTKHIPNEQVSDGIYVDSLAYDMGFRTGDKILKVGDKNFTKFEPNSIVSEIVFNSVPSVTVDRKGNTVVVPIDKKYTKELAKYDRQFFLDARTPFEIHSVVKAKNRLLGKNIPDGPAAKAGLVAGDRIVSINNQPIQYYDQGRDIFRVNAGKTVNLAVQRDNQPIQLTIKPDESGRIGVFKKPSGDFFKLETQEYTWMESIPLGWHKAWNFLGSQLKAFKKMFTGDIAVKESLGSLISIGNLFPGTWNWQAFWNITAVLSLILGFMNLLPIPALDGGYIMFLFWEMITGRKVSDKTMEIANTVGFVILIALMIFALGLDVTRIFK